MFVKTKNVIDNISTLTFSSIQDLISESQTFYEKSFKSLSSIPLRSRFSVVVARRVYRKIGDYILKQKNINNYNKAGKIYVPVLGKYFKPFYLYLILQSYYL